MGRSLCLHRLLQKLNFMFYQKRRRQCWLQLHGMLTARRKHAQPTF